MVAYGANSGAISGGTFICWPVTALFGLKLINSGGSGRRIFIYNWPHSGPFGWC